MKTESFQSMRRHRKAALWPVLNSDFRSSGFESGVRVYGERNAISLIELRFQQLHFAPLVCLSRITTYAILESYIASYLHGVNFLFMSFNGKI